MLNKTLLISLVLAHFHISFATETEDEPTRSCCKLFSFRVMPGEEVLKTKPVSQIKGCSLLDIIKSMFRKKANKNVYPVPGKRSKMPYSVIITNCPNEDCLPNFPCTTNHQYIPVADLLFQENTENPNAKYSDSDLTLFANNLINGDGSSCTLGRYGKFCLNGSKEDFLELPLDTYWDAIVSYEKVIGFFADFYEKNEHDERFTAYRSKVLILA